MISRITGILIEKTPPSICVDVQGVGYDIAIPMHTFYNLPTEGQPVTIFTHLIVREDAHLLYGFQNAVERSVFLQLIKVNGIGARTALAILSGLSVQELQQAIQEQNSQALQKVPGIGKKTAERLLLELRGKIGHTNVVETPSAVGAHADVLAALVALGYAEKEAASVVKKLPVDISVSEGIRQALKWLH